MSVWRERTAVVTGASSGVGAALAAELSGLGVRLILAGRDRARLEAVADLCPGAVPVAGDLTATGTVEALASAVATAGRLDVLVNNAGIQRTVKLFDATPGGDDEEVRQEIEANLVAPILLTRRLAPWLLRAPAPLVVNIGSGLGVAPKRSAPVYSATKAGMRAFSLAARFQGERSTPQVRVMHVTLPLVATPMTAGRNAGAMTPEAAARAIIRGAARGHDDLYVGKARLLPWLLRLAPRRAERLFAAA